MFSHLLPQHPVAIRILQAADALMARDGVQNLSTHKIAKEAGVSVGTIYLYFKDKDELLNQLVMYLFNEFHGCFEGKLDLSLSPFEQYCQLWRITWQFVRENPRVVQNKHQYEALPGFREMILKCQNSEEMAWSRFLKAGQAQGVILPLPVYVLSTMSMSVVWELIYTEMLRDERFSDAVIDEVIARTWKAISC